MAEVRVDPARVREFETRSAFEAWLAEHHASEPEVWIRLFRKGSGRATVSPAEAIDACLAWGWIDAIRKSLDAESFLQRYTPRGRRSIWSLVNVRNVERLTAEGRMRPEGLAQVEAAKADGRWDRAYGGSRDMALPDDLLAAVALDPAAQATLRGLDARNRFALAFRLHNLKTETARARRVAAFVEMLAAGETPHPQRRRTAD